MKILPPEETHDIKRVNRAELVTIVQKLMVAEGTEEEQNEWLQIFADNVPYPQASDLIYWPDKDDQSAEEIVDEALTYKPIQL